MYTCNIMYVSAILIVTLYMITHSFVLFIVYYCVTMCVCVFNKDVFPLHFVWVLKSWHTRQSACTVISQ